MDYTQTIAMIVKPVIGLGLGFIAALGYMHATDDATINLAAQFVGALGEAGVLLWALLHSKQITADKHTVAAVAYVAGSQEGVKPQTDISAPVVQAAARSAVASMK